MYAMLASIEEGDLRSCARGARACEKATAAATHVNMHISKLRLACRQAMNPEKCSS